ncbi:NAD(P)H-hydrate dehydratase [Pelomonas sp. SE-A7]|uniref:NAD(P)H-hydrate dehydratase n=1 Tax=Pelomonas sp. SE-A7 TaxID=3054953 RepID=UPI00259CCE7B|nr:NAD(P)H-hydrate dehydratase [Pelomonas sp. SE-A7]MDM4767376.1 NAD(P)H-hydrate dehydratase [Pelomonas sp. SE-A7]
MLTQVLPAQRSLPLLSAEQCRALEADHHQPPLMERAGLAVAKLALALAPYRKPIQVVCGPGNNGGDGLVAARLLHLAGHSVQVILLAGSKPAPPDAAAALLRAQQAGVAIAGSMTGLGGASLVIDALLGLGQARAPTGEIEQAIAGINAGNAKVLAVDLPSGLSSETGQVHGEAWVRAHHSLALLALKPGLFTGHGREASGQIWFDDLGVQSVHGFRSQLLGADTMRPAALAWHASHKGSRGDVVVTGGARGMQGAARLAGRAALASGAGRVYLDLLGESGEMADLQQPELMCWPAAQRTEVVSWRGRVLVTGCGAGGVIASMLSSQLTAAERLVLDADALNCIAADPNLQQLLAARNSLALATLLTPHPLEAARLQGASVADVQADRLAAAEALAERFACTVVLKGSGTIVATADRRTAVNGSGNAALATPGSGDVLAGWSGGLWAQAGIDADVHELACSAVYWHGAAADLQAAGPLRASDLIERMHSLHTR